MKITIVVTNEEMVDVAEFATKADATEWLKSAPKGVYYIVEKVEIE